MTGTDELLFLEEAAQEFRVSRATLYRWMNSGGLKYVQVGGRRRIYRSALQAFITTPESGGDHAAAPTRAPNAASET